MIVRMFSVSPPQSESSRRRTALAMATLAVIAFGTFANSIVNGYVYDDVTMILKNPLVVNGASAWEILSSPYTTAEVMQKSHYRPLTLLTLVWDRALWGEGPMGIHVVNVLINALLAPLALWLLLRLRIAFGLAFIAALLWSIHPTHAEVVARHAQHAPRHEGPLTGADAAGQRAAVPDQKPRCR